MNPLRIDGLSLPESMMMYLGVLLALIGFIGIIISMVKSNSLTKYLYVVGLAVIMIGWSSIQKVNFGKDIFSIDKTVKEISEQPDNKALYKKLENNVNNLNLNHLTSARSLAVLSKAYLVLGNTNKGVNLADKALSIEPGNMEAANTKILAETNITINRLTLHPEDADAKSLLTSQVEQLSNSSAVDPYKKQVIYDAQITLRQAVNEGNTEPKNEQPVQPQMAPTNLHVLSHTNATIVNQAQQIETIKKSEVPQGQEARKFLMLSREYRQAGDAQLEKQYLDSANAIINKP